MNRFPLSGYIGRTGKHLDEIIRFLKEERPDVIGLIEVDAGSYRSGWKNQAEEIAREMEHYHSYRSKYPEKHPILQKIPILNKQGNAFVCNDDITSQKFHYVNRGVKRLVMELELENVAFLLVHLALSYRVRQEQLRDLKRIVKDIDKPCLVAGDFNVLTGGAELELFKEAAGLVDPSPETFLTFPSWKPNKDLDFVLHTPDIRVTNFRVPRVLYSDHLPVVCDFEADA